MPQPQHQAALLRDQQLDAFSAQTLHAVSQESPANALHAEQKAHAVDIQEHGQPEAAAGRIQGSAMRPGVSRAQLPAHPTDRRFPRARNVIVRAVEARPSAAQAGLSAGGIESAKTSAVPVVRLNMIMVRLCTELSACLVMCSGDM